MRRGYFNGEIVPPVRGGYIPKATLADSDTSEGGGSFGAPHTGEKTPIVAKGRGGRAIRRMGKYNLTRPSVKYELNGKPRRIAGSRSYVVTLCEIHKANAIGGHTASVVVEARNWVEARQELRRRGYGAKWWIRDYSVTDSYAVEIPRARRTKRTADASAEDAGTRRHRRLMEEVAEKVTIRDGRGAR